MRRLKDLLFGIAALLAANTFLLQAQPASPPTISGPAELLIYPSAGQGVISLTVGDEDSGSDSLTLSAFSTNTYLLPVTNIIFGGTGSNRTATLLPTPNILGTSVVRIVVTDASNLRATNVTRVAVTYYTDITPASLSGNRMTPKWGDYDNDDDLDLYLSGWLYRNDGQFTFTRVTNLHGASRHGAAWADYDRDGDLDIAVAGNSLSAIYRNDGNDRFIRLTPSLRSLSGASLTWGDYNNDGRPDLLLASATDFERFIGLYHNNGDHTFTLQTNTGLLHMTGAVVAWGDADNDGRLDVLVNGLKFANPDGVGGQLAADLYHNNGDGTFTPLAAGLAGGYDGSVGFGDYDHDGRLDLLVSSRTSEGNFLRIHHNQGANQFVQLNARLGGSPFDQWLDFDNDGYVDIVPSISYIQRNNRDGTFTWVLASWGTTPSQSSPASAGDVDNDGDLDLLAYGLLRNDCNVSNSPPAAPTGLIAEVLPDNNVRFSWAAPADAHTGSQGLSYALRVGTTPQGVDYLSPHAHPHTGYRRIPERGPINATTHILPDVRRGTFYWSVQAIDAGFAGSPFAAEGTFTVTNARPVVSTIPTQHTVPGRATPPIPFTVSDVETPADELVLNAYSSNPALVSNENIALAGTGANRTATLAPLPFSNGVANIIITATDAAGLVGTSRFDLVVQTFTDANAGLRVLSESASAWADYDNDGDLDVAISGSQFYAYLSRNDGATFSELNLSLPGRAANAMAWIDYNNDGFIDLTQNGWENSSGYNPATLIYQNNFGANSFTTLSLSPTNLADGSIEWADYDNDGDYDFVATGNPYTYHAISGAAFLRRREGPVFTNSGLPGVVFTNSGIALPPVAKGATAFADYDNDGDVDLLIAGQIGPTVSSAMIKLFNNDALSGFAEVPISLPGVTRCDLASGDYDNDGHCDIALAGLDAASNRIARVYRNLGNGSFTDIGAALLGVDHAAVKWGDFDNDGFLDLLVAGRTNEFANSATTRVYRNDRSGGLSQLPETFFPASKNAASWGDYDNDGDLDLLLHSRIFRNLLNISNTPPTAPANLATAITPDFVLSWSPSSDAETSDPRGLTYNLRIGTAPGAGDIMSPHAHSTTGLRRFAQAGNVGAVNEWRINLPNGTYYWSVQAIDAGFRGSPFAPEATFTLSRPIITEFTNAKFTNRSVVVNATLIDPIPFLISDGETAASNLAVTATSSNPNVVANTNFSIAGDGDSFRVLHIRLNPNQSGVTRITISVTDEDGQVTARSFLLTVERFGSISYSYSLAQRPAPAVWGDYDGDGDMDLFHDATIHSNRANGIFVPIFPGVGPAEGSAAWGDYDNDADLDLLVTGSNAARVYRNDSNVLVAINAALQPPSSLGSGAWGDYDNDGDLDIIVAGYSTRIYRNEGSNSFVAQDVGLPSLTTGSTAWGDYDNDGDLDVLLAGSGLVRVYRNNGIRAAFTDVTGTALPGVQYGSAAWGDFDNDGDLDFAVCGSPQGSSSSVVTRIYRNLIGPQGRFFQILYAEPLFTTSSWPLGVWRGVVSWADYDNDGDPDLLVSGESGPGRGSTRIYRNDGGSFVDGNHLLPPLMTSFAAWGDYDRDGDLDLLLSGRQQTGLPPLAAIFRNYYNGPSNALPLAPLNLNSVVVRKSVRLNWSAASDPNQTGGFSYNLRVGRSPGSGDIVSPMSGTDGIRRIAALGNANQSLTWTFTNLTGGTYYWTVQAIDHSFAGSAFAEEQTFVISNQPPVVTNRVVTAMEDEQKAIGVFGYDPDGDPLTFSIHTQPSFGQAFVIPPNLAYRPATNYFGTDQFTYRAHDRTEYSEPAAISIEIVPIPDVTSPSLRIEWLNDNTARLSAYGEPWETGHLEASEDLQNWVTITNFIGTNVLIHLIDPDASNFGKRFYRARWSQTQ